MLFVIVAFRQKPELVAAIVEPFSNGRRKVLACKFGIDEEIRMSRKGHLD